MRRIFKFYFRLDSVSWLLDQTCSASYAESQIAAAFDRNLNWQSGSWVLGKTQSNEER